MSKLDLTSALPLYAQLADHLLVRIRAGALPAGAKIPSEHGLAEEFEIGRPTVRQATETLIRRGYLVRRRGSGTYVAESSRHIDLFSLGGTLESFSKQGFHLDTRVIEQPQLLPPDQAPFLGLATKGTYRMRRCGSVEGEPVLLETFWFDAEVFPALDARKWEGGSVSEAVLAHYRMEASSAEQRFSVKLLGKREAQLLMVEPGSPALHVERVLKFRGARDAVYVEMECRSDKFTFSQRITSEGPLLSESRDERPKNGRMK